MSAKAASWFPFPLIEFLEVPLGPIPFTPPLPSLLFVHITATLPTMVKMAILTVRFACRSTLCCEKTSTLQNPSALNVNRATIFTPVHSLGLSSGGKCEELPRLAQLVEHLTVVV